jgi:hypothetical protein
MLTKSFLEFPANTSAQAWLLLLSVNAFLAFIFASSQTCKHANIDLRGRATIATAPSTARLRSVALDLALLASLAPFFDAR